MPAFLFAFPYEPSPMDKKIINHTFNEEYEEADKIIKQQLKSFPDIPKYYYYYINMRVLDYYKRIAELKPDKREAGRKALNKELINFCEDALKKFDPSKLNTENKFYYGSIHGYLSRVYGLDNSWWGAFRNGMKAEDLMEEILKADQKFYDTYLLLGMLNYYADRLSGVTGFVAGILGYSGDREKGLNQLKLAFDKGTLTFGQSALTLIEVYSSLEDNDYQAINYYEIFLDQFPKNKRILNGYFQKLLSAGEFKKAHALINGNRSDLLEDYTKLIYYNQTGNHAKAVEFAEKALSDPGSLYRGRLENVNFIAAVNNLILGNNNKTAAFEKELEEENKDYFNIIKRNKNDYVWLNNLSAKISSGISIAEFENIIKGKPDFSNARELENQFNVTAGKFYFWNNSYQRAEEYLFKSADSNDRGGMRASLKYLTEIFLRVNADKKKVERVLDMVDDLDNDRLSFRAKDLEKKYNL